MSATEESGRAHFLVTKKRRRGARTSAPAQALVERYRVDPELPDASHHCDGQFKCWLRLFS